MKILLLTLALLTPATALAAPALKGDITVTAGIVTVGDMFDNAGPLAGTALFRAPAPGTTGIVPLADVASAAKLVGLTDFDTAGISRVRVMREASIVDTALLSGLMADDLRRRGILTPDMTIDARFDIADISINAEAVDTPAVLTDLRYLPQSARFSARFTIAGIDQPLDVSGTIDLLVPAPRLVTSLSAGAVLTAADFETAMVPQASAIAGGYADIDDLIGKQLQRQSRAGMMLKLSDVAEPVVVTRNALVMVLLRSGAMTLTVKGQALGNAAAGEPVDVLNTLTKKILHGIARPDGSVEIVVSYTVAGL